SLHAMATERLPDIHRDPFDRLLVAQAETEGIRLLTADETLPDYGPVVLKV
ncbi:MAG: PIN domain nuclease, partial [Gammaproteobacteria bacterium]